MSNVINDNLVDDKELNEYLSGDTMYSRRYEAIATDDVPVELDRLVLANAAAGSVTPITTATSQRVVGRRRVNSLAYWMRASIPVALAASVVLAISIMMDGGVRRNATAIDDKYSQSQASTPAVKLRAEPISEAPQQADAIGPAPVAVRQLTAEKAKRVTAEKAKRDAQATDAIAESRTLSQATAKSTTSEEMTRQNAEVNDLPVDARAREQAARPTAPAAIAPATTVYAAPSANADAGAGIVTDATASESDKRASATRNDAALKLEEVIVTAQRRPSSGAGVGPRSSIPLASFDEREPSDAEIAKERREANPVTWVAYIRELRADGKTRAADREWQRFTKAYPNFTVDALDTARPKKK